MEGGRYSKVYRRMWNDDKFRRLSRPQPCGQSLWMRFLCGPELGPIPGLFSAREPGLADAMGWPLEPFRESFRELLSNGLAEADWEAGLVWVPNAIRYNEPANPNVVKSWADSWAELPECNLKTEAHSMLCEYLETRGESFVSTFRNHCRNHSPNHCPNQEQDQKQEQEQEGERPKVASARVRPRTAHELHTCLRAAVEREHPENGMWNPGGSFAYKEAQDFLAGFADIEAALADIEKRIGIFAKDPAMSPWTVAKFSRNYNGLGQPKRSDGKPAPKPMAVVG